MRCGFGLADVDYRGSTGYGRAYRDALEHRWGIVDVDDCAAAARHLVEAGRVDGERLVITGGSAGGYTTLASLAFRDVHRAGASHYGVSDLEALMADTHKFESRYDVYLIGPDESGERADVAVMRERSPIHAADRLDCPVIFIQGLEDRVVPPNQAERVVAALDDKGIGVAYVAFEGEQHGLSSRREHRPRPRGRALLLRRGAGLPPRRRHRARADPQPPRERPPQASSGLTKVQGGAIFQRSFSGGSTVTDICARWAMWSSDSLPAYP